MTLPPILSRARQNVEQAKQYIYPVLDKRFRVPRDGSPIGNRLNDARDYALETGRPIWLPWGQFGLDVPFDPAGVVVNFPHHAYSRENDRGGTANYVDRGTVFLHLAEDEPAISPSGGGWAMHGAVFFDPVQLGAGSTPILTRPPLIKATAPARLIDITFTENVVINALDILECEPNSLLGDVRWSRNQCYAIRFGLLLREWMPESLHHSDNIYTPGIYQDAAIVQNLAMLAKWTEENGINIAIDMSEAVLGNTVDGLQTANDLFFGAAGISVVNGGLNVSRIGPATWDSCRVGLLISDPGFTYSLNISAPTVYSSQNRRPTRRTRIMQFSTTGVVRVTLDGGRWENSAGDAFVDDGSGRTVLEANTHLGTFGSAPAGAVTVTIASPAIFNRVDHLFLNNEPVVLATTGALPTGFTAGTIYYVVNRTADTFQLAATVGGSAINGSGTQSGTHTVRYGGDAYGFRIANPNGRYYLDNTRIDNYGGGVNCIGVSVVEAETVSCKGMAFNGMKRPIVVEQAMASLPDSRVIVMNCHDENPVAGATKSLEVHPDVQAVSPAIVRPKVNEWKLTADVVDIV